jgi:hypothetical protein
MVITKKLEWMRDYINEVEHLVPKVKYLRRITAKQCTPDQKQHIHGMFTYADNKHYRITLYVTRKERNTHKIIPYTAIEMLHNLAHELSHILTLEHTPERMKLECVIMTQFMNKLSREGYISEEVEQKTQLFYG